MGEGKSPAAIAYLSGLLTLDLSTEIRAGSAWHDRWAIFHNDGLADLVTICLGHLALINSLTGAVQPRALYRQPIRIAFRSVAKLTEWRSVA